MLPSNTTTHVFFLKVFSGTSCGIQLFLIEIKCSLLDLKVTSSEFRQAIPIYCSRKWQLTLVFWLKETYGQRNLVGYSLWGCKELDITEHTSTHACTRILKFLFWYN